MKKPKIVPILSFLSRITWILVWLVTLFLINYYSLNIKGTNNWLLSLIVTGIVFVIDFNIHSQKIELKSDDRYSLYVGYRFIISTIFMWLGSYAIVSKIFEESFLNSTFQTSRTNLDVFTDFFRINNDISISFILIAIALFIIDLLPFLLLKLKEKNEAIKVQNKELRIKNEALIQQKIKLNEAYEQQLKIIKIMEHDLGRKLAYASMNLENFMTHIKDFKSINLNEKIPKIYDDDDDIKSDSYNDYLKRVENNLKYAISVVLNIPILVKADPLSWKPGEINIKTFLTSTIEKEIKNHENIKYHIHGSDPIIPIDKSQFEILLHNIIKNAVMHGKKDNNEELLIDFEVKEIIKNDLKNGGQNSQTKLIIRNNGNPLPEGFTIEKFKEPSIILGPTGHTGLGGHLIAIIAQNHEAFLEIKPSAPPFSVQLSLIFKPIFYACNI